MLRFVLSEAATSWLAWYEGLLPAARGVELAALVACIVSWLAKSSESETSHTHDDHDRIDKLEGRVDTLQNRLDARHDCIETLREHTSSREPPRRPTYPWVAPYED